jgi:cysteine-rich repeat protein
MQCIDALSISLNDASFNYVIDSIEQMNYTNIILIFRISYSFSSMDASWSNQDVQINGIVPVYGLSHPTFSAYYGHISNDWIEDASTVCLVNQLFDGLKPCNSYNIRPDFVCGNGVKEGAEECDAGNNINGDGCSRTCEIE